MNHLLSPSSDPDRWPALLDNLAGQDPEEARVPISQYVWILKRHRWRILGFCAAMVLLTVVVSARLTPVFESTTTVDVDRETPSGVVGQDATRGATNDADQFLATQMKLVQSDGVLRPVDQRLRLRLREQSTAAQSLREEAAPIVLKHLRVTRPPNTCTFRHGRSPISISAAATPMNSGHGRSGPPGSPLTTTVPCYGWPMVLILLRHKSPNAWGTARLCSGRISIC